MTLKQAVSAFANRTSVVVNGRRVQILNVLPDVLVVSPGCGRIERVAYSVVSGIVVAGDSRVSAY